MMILRAALFNSLPYHYEVFGSFIYYCFKKGYPLTIFTETKENYGWITFYQSHFSSLGFSFNIYPYQKFTPAESLSFDLILVPTAEDSNIPRYDQDKMVCLRHTTRFKFKVKPLKMFFTRNTTGGNISDVWTPVFPMGVARNPSLKTPRKTILLIGTRLDDKNMIQELSRHFKIIHASRKSALHKSIQKCEKCDLAKMIEFANNTDFIGIFVKKNNQHVHKTMSGSIPFALSMRIPLILPKEMNQYYRLQSAIEYDIGDTASLIQKITSSQPDSTLLERDLQNLIRQNHKSLDSLLTNKLPRGTRQIEFFSSMPTPHPKKSIGFYCITMIALIIFFLLLLVTALVLLGFFHPAGQP